MNLRSRYDQMVGKALGMVAAEIVGRGMLAAGTNQQLSGSEQTRRSYASGMQQLTPCTLPTSH